MIRHTTVKTLPWAASVAGRGREDKKRLKENAGAMIGETNVEAFPRTASVAREGARRRKAKTNTKWKGGTTYSPARGGKCLPS